jgi:hypothetical protein
MFKRAVVPLIASALSLMTSTTVFAQTGPGARVETPSLSELLPALHGQLIDAEDVLFSRNDVLALKKARLDTVLHINNLLAAQLASFPLGSSAGGFTWTFEPVAGTFTRASDSFGPLFTERALTIGRNKLNVGVNYQRVTFDHLDGKKLTGGEILGYTGLPFYLGSEARPDGIFFQEALDLELTTNTVSVFATYGVSDRLDVGVAVPINRVQVKASFVSLYGNTIGGASSPNRPEQYPECASYWTPWIQFAADISFYVPPVTPNGCGLRAEASGTATGIGDVVVRAKYSLLRSHGGGLAGGVDVRLPTGDEQNLLGVAGAQAKLYLAASTGLGRLSPHVNIGYTVSGASDAAGAASSVLIAPPDEVNYAGGADVSVTLRTTVVVDILGRTLRRVGTLEEVPSLFGTRGGNSAGERTVFQELRLLPGADLRLLLGSVGMKFNPVANLLVSGNVLFPLSNRGLTDNLSWLLGFDYSF